jgi:hypothetical protein
MHMEELRQLDRRFLKNEILLQKRYKVTFNAWLDDKVGAHLMLTIMIDEDNH